MNPSRDGPPQMPSYAPAPRPGASYQSAIGPSCRPPSGPSYAPPPTGPVRGHRDAALEGRKLFIGGIATTGIGEDVIRYDFSKFGELEDCFVPADHTTPGKIRGIAFVPYREQSIANIAIQEMNGRNYHGREISVNVAKPRGPDPKRDGTFHTDERYSGKYDAGGRLRPELRGTSEDPEFTGRPRGPDDPRYDERSNDAERERDYQQNSHSHGSS